MINNKKNAGFDSFLDHSISVKTWDGSHTLMRQMKRMMEN